MEKVTSYYAYDLTEFTTQEACEKYENKVRHYIDTWNHCCTFFDENMNTLYVPAGTNTELISWFYTMLDGCDYIEITETLSPETYSFIDESFGRILPENKVGLYKYSYDENNEFTWVRVD